MVIRKVMMQHAPSEKIQKYNLKPFNRVHISLYENSDDNDDDDDNGI